MDCGIAALLLVTSVTVGRRNPSPGAALNATLTSIGFASKFPMKTRTTGLGNKIRFSILVLVSLLAAFSTAAFTQQSDASEHARKVVRRVDPIYPELAKPLKMRGTVRLIAVVAPNGSVKFIEALGGNPVLVKSAQDAVIKWKYAAAPEESRETIEVHFSPD